MVFRSLVNISHSFVRHGSRALVAAAALLAAQAASADTLVYKGPWFGSYSGTYAISDTNPSPGVSVTAYSGAFKMTDTNTGNTFMAWCVDIYDYMNTSASGTSYTLTSGTGFYSGAMSYVTTDLERLASYVFDNDLVTGSAASAAFQLAVWEIVNDSAGTGHYDVTAGDFKVTTSSSFQSVLTQANTWLGIVNSGTYAIGEQLSIWKQNCSGCTQDLAVFAPIPEPETVVMLLSGLALMGFVVRRRMKALDGKL
jgi:PEP-CTERM motif